MKSFVGAILIFTIFIIYADAGTTNLLRGSIKHATSDLRQHDEPIYGNNIPGHEAQIADQYFELNPDSYRFGYLQTDLQRRSEEATFKEDPETKEIVLEKVTGYYKYVRPDGKWQRVDYEADANGFRPIVVVSDDEPITDESVFETLNQNQNQNQLAPNDGNSSSGDGEDAERKKKRI